MNFIPTPEEFNQMKTLSGTIRETLSVLLPDATIKPVGSVAKMDFLAGDGDIDIFVVSNFPEIDFFKVSKKFPFGVEKRNGTLKVWNMLVSNVPVDIVFVCPNGVKFDTLAHVDFFNERLTDEMRLQVITAKALFKTFGVKDAETGGITGVAIETLIWKLRTVKNLCEFFTRNNTSKWFVQDPVLKTKRNLLASINIKRQQQLRRACLMFLHDEWEFKPFTVDSFLKCNEGNMILSFKKGEMETSLAFTKTWGIVAKAMRMMKSFEPDLDGDFDVFVDDDTITVAIDASPEVDATKVVSVNVKFGDEVIQKFREKHPEAVLKNDKWQAVVPRKFTNPQKFVASVVSALM